MFHTHPDYSRRPINGKGATSVYLGPTSKTDTPLDQELVFEAWTENVKRGAGLKGIFSTNFGIFYGLVLRTTQLINLMFYIGKHKFDFKVDNIDTGAV